ncbi:orotidine-5'-phosphate decarboxylase [Staphylococcus massiliensis]|uniref:Orotidine 5'-phosphate decarboxylase n=1 Tax=Staphylococcus massiliensis S46 TaxID=1229783 RepID=K9B9K9_9STAP|nr:orotidine-5'-phosphate decarboxylase [Staphylococcus massiliensis]EKU50405.1 orotidine 5'-phosphate decarboxylase [Staphylococcus massiliensis S46]MCG3398825.1 orotidine-5'-phosphate decarboxylase [Staphylococcus massiliensis]MCG3401386.1 orotidine-5'-phosphate decarboxylase [Staphylococcus massiliensis]MCG3411832.1 orotidine-5'-phosphate decarboxylase [Staphylococcus massiliensis]POA00518.1 orotidine-5'-phosphate decarboxylase [Staphylococcus massiliensis CCUG 55927]
MKDLPIIALDFNSLEKVETFLDQFDEPLFVKVGMELFYQEGPRLIEKIKSRGHAIFLDLKLHDIPNTVKKAMEGLAKLDVDLVNVHAAGGTEMMKAAIEGLRSVNPDIKIIAVTQLTSTTEAMLHDEQNIQTSIEDAVLNYAKLAQSAGLDGVVCSPLEAKLITDEIGEAFLKVTPGIRLENANRDDQKRVTTPEEARQNGSTHIVVGRPITQSTDPVQSYKEIKESWLR